jgi:hypothetical protein
LAKDKTLGAPSANEKEWPSRIDFFFTRSTAHRVIHVDGAWGGITAPGLIGMSLYSTRSNLPEVVSRDVMPDGSSEEAGRIEKKGVVHEVEVTAIMTKETAASLVRWLQEKMEALDTAVTEQKKAAEKFKPGKSASPSKAKPK